MDNTIAINGETYRRVYAGESGLKIIVVDNRGLTFVGYCDLDGDEDFIQVLDARCVIRWGTTEHLAQLVDGPTSDTVLGRKADVVVARRSVVAYYDASAKGWEKHV